jgi:hypothetical protein
MAGFRWLFLWPSVLAQGLASLLGLSLPAGCSCSDLVRRAPLPMKKGSEAAQAATEPNTKWK